MSHGVIPNGAEVDDRDPRPAVVRPGNRLTDWAFFLPTATPGGMEIVVHAGTGSGPEHPTKRRMALEAATSTAATALEPAVVEAVAVLESDPRFNAGVGDAVQSGGRVRTDDGRTGGACAMAGVGHAARVARIVAHETPHVLVAGDRAVALAEAFDVPTGCDLLT